MSPLNALTPVWIGFEVLQLVFAERYLGVKQIQADRDPRNGGPSEFTSFLWFLLICCYWVWMVAMACMRLGLAQLVTLLAVSSMGYLIRRSCGLKWVLVVLTFEGAIRIGMLVSLCAVLWRESV